MNRVRNATEFRLKLREIRGAYEQGKRIIEQQREQYTNNLPEALSPNEKEDLKARRSQEVDIALEAHIRQYIVDPLFNALNWRFDSSPEIGLPNLVPEAPVRSSISSGKSAGNEIKFLDYLGMESGTKNALLIIETKHSNKFLPQERYQRKSTTESSVCEVLLKYLTSPEESELTDEWKQWLDKLRNYVQSVKDKSKRPPGRVVSTNGDWLILFANPEKTFLNSSASNLADIRVYKDIEALDRETSEIFGLLEYQNVLSSVLGKIPILELGEIGFYVRPEFIERAMYGLYIVYFEARGSKYEMLPIIRVTPMVFLGLNREPGLA